MHKFDLGLGRLLSSARPKPLPEWAAAWQMNEFAACRLFARRNFDDAKN